VFANLDLVPAQEGRDPDQVSDIVRNEVEAKLVVQVTESLLLAGVPASSIGIISPWRSQLKSIHHFLGQRGLQQHQLEVLTVDKYQGRDKDCIIFSLVRSNAQKIVRTLLLDKKALFNPFNQVGTLLRDWRRINVALTRAKQKLIIFGSKSTLESTPLFRALMTLIEQNNWRYDLPVGADTTHLFPPVSKLASSTTGSMYQTSQSPRRLGKRTGGPATMLPPR